MSLVLDSEAVSRLIAAGVSQAGSTEQRAQPRRVHPGEDLLAALAEARTRGWELTTTAGVLSEQYLGRHPATVDAFLSSNPFLMVLDTDRVVARDVGQVLDRAGRGSADHVDATVAIAAIRDRGQPTVVATSDPGDIGHLLAAGGATHVRVLPLT